jgi:zinc protease
MRPLWRRPWSDRAGRRFRFRSAVEPQLAKLFGDWTARIAYVRVPRPYRESGSASQQLETPDKANAFYIARLGIPLRDDDAAIEPLMLGDRILGSGGLKSRIAARLRQQDGISYGAGSGLNPRPL